MKTTFREIIITIAMVAFIFIIFQTVIQSSIVDGSSMLPSLQDGQRLIVVKAAYMFNDPQRGDIVIVHPPVAPQNQWVKRIIGLPGDTIRVKNQIVYVNNIPLSEPYIKAAPEYTLSPYKVPVNNYFVMGDNRNNSTDSHYGWTVSRENIIGEVWLRIWPLNQWGIVYGYPITIELQGDNQAQRQ
jgi:signal peptidase I